MYSNSSRSVSCSTQQQQPCHDWPAASNKSNSNNSGGSNGSNNNVGGPKSKRRSNRPRGCRGGGSRRARRERREMEKQMMIQKQQQEAARRDSYKVAQVLLKASAKPFASSTFSSQNSSSIPLLESASSISSGNLSFEDQTNQQQTNQSTTPMLDSSGAWMALPAVDPTMASILKRNEEERRSASLNPTLDILPPSKSSMVSFSQDTKPGTNSAPATTPAELLPQTTSLPSQPILQEPATSFVETIYTTSNNFVSAYSSQHNAAAAPNSHYTKSNLSRQLDQVLPPDAQQELLAPIYARPDLQSTTTASFEVNSITVQEPPFCQPLSPTLDRIEKQRNMLAGGGSLFLTSPRSFLTGTGNKSQSLFF